MVSFFLYREVKSRLCCISISTMIAVLTLHCAESSHSKFDILHIFRAQPLSILARWPDPGSRCSELVQAVSQTYYPAGVVSEWRVMLGRLARREVPSSRITMSGRYLGSATLKDDVFPFLVLHLRLVVRRRRMFTVGLGSVVWSRGG